MRRLLRILLVAYLLVPGAPARAQVFDLSFPRLNAAQGERLIGLEVRLKGARVLSIRELPVGWGIFVENDANWRAKISGSVRVGAAAEDPSVLAGLIRIEKQEVGTRKFAVEVTIYLSKDLERYRKVTFRRPGVVLTPWPGASR